MKARNDMISELNARVKSIHAGSDKHALMIREGIFVPKAGAQAARIPDNYKVLIDASSA